MSNELVIHTVGDMWKMAESIANSGLFGMKTPDQAMALMLIAQAEGLHPATIAQDYDIIQGRAARKTHSVLARFQKAGGNVEWHELTEQKADATFSHPSGGSLRLNWTIEQAKRSNLLGKDNWKNYPRAMLRARLVGEGVRSVYPAAIGGSLLVEEAQDMDPSALDAIDRSPRAKPAVAMPQAKATVQSPAADAPNADVQDVEAKQPIAKPESTFASPGEVAYIKTKLAKKGINISDARQQTGLSQGDAADSWVLTKDEFITLKDAFK